VTDWRTPEEILEIGFARSRVVMCNEAHNGMLRCVRTREIGRRLLPVARDAGCRHLAMEALPHDRPFEGGYLDQPEMRALIDEAVQLGFELIPYETRDTRSPFVEGGVDMEIVNARERDQAANLAAALPDTALLVWCGNSHQSKRPSEDGWTPMGWCFRELTGIDFFAVDQTWTVFGEPLLGEELRGDLEPLGGTAGMLREELPPPFDTWSEDALLFSIDNELV
jgi:hypothetical protein